MEEKTRHIKTFFTKFYTRIDKKEECKRDSLDAEFVQCENIQMKKKKPQPAGKKF